MNHELHVVFGTGPAGRATIDALSAAGHRVRAVNRSSATGLPDGVDPVVADVTDRATMRELCAGATAIYNCTHAPYPVWADVLPRLQEAFLDGAEHSGAKLVAAGTLYVYGPTGGAPMTEHTPHAATSVKGRIQTELTTTYLRAHADGRARVSIGRAADYVGPRVLDSVLGGTVFPQALAGQPVLALGDIDLPHGYSYIHDVGRGLATLGTHDAADGHEWHLPIAPVVSTRAIHELIAEEIGVPVTADVLTEPAPWGPFDAAFMAEYAELFYQYTEPQIMDSTAFEQTFGWTATPLPEAVRSTVAWYREFLSE